MLAGAWCEAIVADIPRAVRRSGMPVRPVVVNETGPLVADLAPPPLIWAARLAAARAVHDDEMFQALIDAVPADELELHLAGLLHAAAIAVVERGE